MGTQRETERKIDREEAKDMKGKKQGERARGSRGRAGKQASKEVHICGVKNI